MVLWFLWQWSVCTLEIETIKISVSLKHLIQHYTITPPDVCAFISLFHKYYNIQSYRHNARLP